MESCEEFDSQSSDFAASTPLSGRSRKQPPKLQIAWSDEDVEKLLAAVEVEPAIWDVAKPEYHGRTSRDKAWRKIPTVLGNFTSSECSAKWKSIHAIHRRLKAGQKTKKSGSAAQSPPSCRFWQCMKYLTEMDREISATTDSNLANINISNNSNSNNNSNSSSNTNNNNNSSSNNDSNSNSNSSSNSSSNTNNSTKNNGSRKRKAVDDPRRNDEEAFQKTVGILNRSDDHQIFGDFVAAELRSYGKKSLALQCKAKLQTVLAEFAILKCEQQDDSVQYVVIEEEEEEEEEQE